MNYEKTDATLWEDILPFVEKPGRYLGGEVHALRRDRHACRLSFALAFPDTYEVGMSHLGIQILYAILNSRADISAERVYAPWPDMEARMRERGIPLCSLESRTPLSSFDIVGFSLQYELSFTNVLNMMDLGGIPLRARDRGEGSPIVIAGGPCAFNPAPMAPFFDALVIGEGEDVVMEIARAVTEAKEEKRSRKDMLSRLAAIEGIYVPALQPAGKPIRKRAVADLNHWTHPASPIIPLIKTVHDRVNLEIARGCTRGCRFCQAGMVWRPVRERRPEILDAMAERMLRATGCDEISLLSLSTGDYSRIEDLLGGLMNRYQASRVAVGLPSLRVETLTPRLIEEIKRVRKTSFTLAPEAGTQRLRNIINKGNSAEDLLETTRHVFAAGWRSVKLYFMLGLPGEKEEDLDGIADLAWRVLKEGGMKRQVIVSVSSFVPKPHTPFQWAGQIGIEEILRRQALLKGKVRYRNLSFKWHDARMSFLEGIFSRGDERLAELIERAFRLGCRFDGWTERFRFDLWEQALADEKVRPDAWLRERDLSEPLPWDLIDCGIEKGFLRDEWQKSLRGDLTEDCRSGVCHACGVCAGPLQIRTAGEDGPPGSRRTAEEGERAPASPLRKKWRIRFAKRGTSRFLSHLETASALERGIRQGGVSFVYSEGFHPQPRMSFASALPVGVQSLAEYADIQVENPEGDREEMIRRINSFLPLGMEILEAEEISFQDPSLFDIISGYRYEMFLAGESGEEDLKIRDFLESESFVITKNKRGKSLQRDIRPLVAGLSYDRLNRLVRLTIRLREGGGVKPEEILTGVLGLDGTAAKKALIVRTEAVFQAE
jgi:radical SAM family uncharacterized protein/radical SAM-linked protein